MGYWFKSFEDGEIIQGTDNDVYAKMVSWCRGRLDGMSGADVVHNDIHIGIIGKGEYFQSDTIETVFPSDVSHIIKRRIEKQINVDDKTYSTLRIPGKGLLVEFGKTCPNQVDEIINVDNKDIGKWLVVEMDLRTSKFKCYMSENKV
jgi:hypothetical protein